MNDSFSPSTGSAPAQCWCGNARLEDFSPDYWRCADCETLVVRAMRGEEISQVRDDERDFYGKNYYLRHVQEDYGLPDLATRARADLPERCLHWLRTMLKFIPAAGASTLELGCGHGGFVAMQRWAGLDATGLELSPWLVRQARAWFNVPVLEGRLEDQDLTAASLDAVILLDVLEHLPNPRQTLGRALSLLRAPGSFLLIQTPSYPAGCSYQDLCARQHPFLQQLKPLEHLHLFSEQAVQRLCAELGAGEVRFEPAIFAHYDLFALASASPLPERPPPERAEMLLAAPAPARAALALLDLAGVRDELQARCAALEADCAALRETVENQGGELIILRATSAQLWPGPHVAENERAAFATHAADLHRLCEELEADRAARLEVIEQQGAEIGRLHAEVHRLLAEARETAPMLDAAVNARNLLAAQLEDLRGHFERSEADRAARLAVITSQGNEIAGLHAEVDRWLGEARRVQAELEAVLDERNLLAAQSADLRAYLDLSETAGAAASALAESQAGDLARIRTLAASLESTRATLAAEAGDLRAENAALAAEAAGLRGRLRTVEGYWATRLLRKVRLWPL